MSTQVSGEREMTPSQKQQSTIFEREIERESERESEGESERGHASERWIIRESV